MSKDKISRFFMRLTNNIKLYHWCTKRYSRHVLSDNLYEKLESLTDQYLEIYFSKYGRPLVKKEKHLTINVIKMTDLEALLYIKQVVQYLTNHKKLFVPATNDTDLENIIDEIVGVLNQHVYLFETKD